MKSTRNAQRRNFLLAAGVGGAGVATALVAGRKAKPAAKAAGSASDGRTAYRASAHVLKYYKTTEV
jgi:hypothetical protein